MTERAAFDAESDGRSGVRFSRCPGPSTRIGGIAATYQTHRIRGPAERAEEIVVDMTTRAQQEAVAKLDLDLPIPDGRALADWTIGELRALNGAFADALAKAGAGDDARTVRQVLAD